MRYASFKFLQKQNEKAYRIYVTDSLRIIGENGGRAICERWIDAVTPKKQDTRTAEEIVADIVKKAGLVVKKSESV